MNIVSIRSLKPNVTQSEALEAFRAGGLSSLVWRMRTGPLQRIADAYVPFRLYRARYAMNQARQARIFGLDAVDGSLDLFEFAKVPEESEQSEIATRNFPPAVLEAERAQEILREKALRVIFQQGFFKLRSASLEIEPLPGEFYLPYWLGFYGDSKALRCRAMDAVRRRMEGAKASAFFEQWLAA
jgi:hypothetical protein